MEQEQGTPSRRRGVALEDAIYAATLDELIATSFEELTFERIAARAGAGKASVYRRWSDPADLVLAALESYDSPEPDRFTLGEASLRDELIAVLTELASRLELPHGRALRPLMTQRDRHPALYARVFDLMVRPRQSRVSDVLLAAAARGEIVPQAVTPLLVRVGPQLIVAQHMDTGAVTIADVVEIVEQIILPAAHRI